MLRIRPKSWVSWDFIVERNGQPLTLIDMAWVREAAEVEIGGVACRFYRKGMLGDFVMEVDGQPVVRATKPSAFTRRFRVTYQGHSYILQAASPFTRRFVLLDGEQEIGQVKTDNPFSRKASVTFPDDVPAEVQVFLIWLVVLLWKRAAAAASGS
jgi:hypothetical protein